MKEFFSSNKRIKSMIAGILAILGALGIDVGVDLDPDVITTAIASIAGVVMTYMGGQSVSDTWGKGKVEAAAKATVPPVVPPPLQGE